MLKAVIYDLDGTLIDSREDLADAVNAALAVLKLPALPDTTVIGNIGGGAERLVRRSLAAVLGAAASDSQAGSGAPIEPSEDLLRRGLAAWHDAYSACLLEKTKLYPGIAALLELPPTARAVLTNKPGKFARRIVEGLGLAKSFAQVIGGDEIPRKPDPGGLLSLCRSLGARPDEALLVGDMSIDIETGAAAGVPVCAVSWGFASRADLVAANPSHLVESADELASLLLNLSS